VVRNCRTGLFHPNGKVPVITIGGVVRIAEGRAGWPNLCAPSHLDPVLQGLRNRESDFARPGPIPPTAVEGLPALTGAVSLQYPAQPCARPVDSVLPRDSDDWPA